MIASFTSRTGDAFDAISCTIITEVIIIEAVLKEVPVNSSSRILKLQPHLAGHVNQKKSNLP